MSEYKGEAGTIYTEYADSTDGYRWEAWFEDFHIIGTGDSERSALEDAVRFTEQLGTLTKEALAKVIIGDDATSAAGSGG